ncbi:MAG TPA: fluoride efflux transporter CrcB [Gaiella sp.]|nr:fluoride efflux transporter CrcB [Gaiella sp.]
MSLLGWIGVAVLGGAGTLLRFRLDGVVQQRAGGSFPLGTLTVNLLGSFCLGLLVGAGVGDTLLVVLGTGFLGSFTTFSTWMFETERSAEEGDGALAVLNLLGPLGCGLAAAGLGWALGASL